MQFRQTTHFLRPFPDDPELDAQVPAEVPPGARQRHPPAALLHLPHLRLQGVRLYCGHRLPEREGHPAEDRPQPLRQGVQGHRRSQGDEEVSEINRFRILDLY